jgi:mono/diheme cytochrome c family protein
MLRISRSWPVLALVGWRLAAPCASAQAAPAPLSLPAGPTLVFAGETNHCDAKPEDTSESFTIYVTNVWTNAIVIESVHTSCHCTAASMPATPWVLYPGQSGPISARVELEGQEGLVVKELTFFTSVGERVVTLEVSVPPSPRPGDTPQSEAERQAAVLKAAADPRAIFKGDCAVCHADKARGLLGGDLYAAACGICHDSPRRAGVVPDLRALKEPTGLDYWTGIISNGKPNTMMPGFAQEQGGPLTGMQVSSLAAWLDQNMTRRPPPR